MTNQIETTWQGAFCKCTKEGGRVKRKGGEVWFIVLDSGEIRCENQDDIFKMFSNDLARVWIYEPPQKSAFQEWRAKQTPEYTAIMDTYPHVFEKLWNAAIGAVLEAYSGDTDLICGMERRLEKLKEP